MDPSTPRRPRFEGLQPDFRTATAGRGGGRGQRAGSSPSAEPEAASSEAQSVGSLRLRWADASSCRSSATVTLRRTDSLILQRQKPSPVASHMAARGVMSHDELRSRPPCEPAAQQWCMRSEPSPNPLPRLALVSWRQMLSHANAIQMYDHRSTVSTKHAAAVARCRRELTREPVAG